VDGADAGALAAEGAADVHEAGVIGAGAGFGVGAEDALELVREHGGGDVGILDGEGAAEAAALVGVGEFNEGEAFDLLEEVGGLGAKVERAEAVAGGVEGDGVGVEGTDVGEAELVGEEFRELEDAGEDGGDPGLEGGVVELFGHFGVVGAYHGDAGGGGADDDFSVGEDFEELAEEGVGVVPVAGVVVHLATTGLGGAEFDGVAEAFEDGNDGLAGLGKEGVVVASDEE